eukprot:gene4916-34682_t
MTLDLEHHLDPLNMWYCSHAPEGVQLAYQLMPGVKTTGPYSDGVQGTPKERVDSAIQLFQASFGDHGRQGPAMVLFNFNLRDLATLMSCEEAALRYLQGSYNPLDHHQHWSEPPLDVFDEYTITRNTLFFLPPPIQLSFITNFTVLVHHTRAVLPADVLYFYLTVPHFQHYYSSGQGAKQAHNRFGRVQYQAQLNAAVREVARRQGLHLIDLERMLRGFTFDEYLDHSLHTTGEFVIEIANIMLNVQRQQRQRGQQQQGGLHKRQLQGKEQQQGGQQQQQELQHKQGGLQKRQLQGEQQQKQQGVQKRKRQGGEQRQRQQQQQQQEVGAAGAAAEGVATATAAAGGGAAAWGQQEEGQKLEASSWGEKSEADDVDDMEKGIPAGESAITNSNSNSDLNWRCDYSKLAGYWDLNRLPGIRYQVWDPHCRLKDFGNYSDAYPDGMRQDGGGTKGTFPIGMDSNATQTNRTSSNGSDSTPSPKITPPSGPAPQISTPSATPPKSGTLFGQAPQISILLLGDSVTEVMLRSLCWELAGGEIEEVQIEDISIRGQMKHCSHNRTELIDIAYMLIPGVHPSGPFHSKVQPNATERSSAALAVFRKTFQGRSPNVVVINCNLWDQARALENEKDTTFLSVRPEDLGIVNQHPKLALENPLNILRIPTLPLLERWWLDEWKSNFTLVVHHVRGLLPGVPLVYHTVPGFHHNLSTGYAMGDAQLRFGRLMYLRQMNAVGRQACAELDIHVLDLETMLAGWPPPAYLADGWHPTAEVFSDVNNVLLNKLAQLGVWWAEPRGEEEWRELIKNRGVVADTRMKQAERKEWLELLRLDAKSLPKAVTYVKPPNLGAAWGV